MTASPLAFPSFSDLPPEIRSQVWQSALPDKIEPSLFFYERGCWCPRRLSESDQEYDPADNNLVFEFRHDLLDRVQVEVPLLFVNSEACRIAQDWLLKQGMEMRFREDRQHHVLVRPFNPMHDTLYVALDKWNDFCCEPFDRLFEPDLINQNVSCGPGLPHIALPETVLFGDSDELPMLFDWFYRLETLTIIIDAEKDLRREATDEKVQRQWKLKSTQEKTFFWNCDCASFDLRDGPMGDGTLYKRIKEATEGLCDTLVRNHVSSFEIRRAYAVRG